MNAVKVCPKCGYENDLTAMYCACPQDGGGVCDFNIFDVPITDPSSAVEQTGEQQANPTVDPSSERRTLRYCVNGHEIADDDIVCIDCGAESVDFDPTSQTPETQVLGSWQILDQIAVEDTTAEHYRVQNIELQSPSQTANLKLFHHGFSPLEEVQLRLSEIQSPYIARLLETGSHDGRFFEVYEALDCDTLADLPSESTCSPDFVRALISQLCEGLESLHRANIQHRDLSLSKVFVRSLSPIEFTLSGFSSSAISEFELKLESSRKPNRYTAPECFAGVSSMAADWWSLGIIVLELLSGGTVFDGVDDRAFHIQILTQAAPIPDQFDPEFQLLLRGLLTRDHTKRWGHSQVSLWIQGRRDISHDFHDYVETTEHAATIRLNGVVYRSASRYALSAAQECNWDEALNQLATGELATWIAEDPRLASTEAWSSIVNDRQLTDDERLMLTLLVLNPQLPLCCRGQVISPLSLPNNPEQSLCWIRDQFTQYLEQLGRELWLVDLARRRVEAKFLAQKFQIPQDEQRQDALALISQRETLEFHWLQRQFLWPDVHHSSLSVIATRASHTDEELVVLLATPLTEFRSADDVLEEAEAEARCVGIETWDRKQATEWFKFNRRELNRVVSDRLADFTRCGNDRIDDWADTYRFEYRLSLPRMLVLLSIPEGQWIKPEGAERWRRLMKFFGRRVATGIKRGPLMSLRLSPNSARFCLAELGPSDCDSSELLDHLVSRSGGWKRVDPSILAQRDNLPRRLRRLKNNSETHQRETGIASLYLGFPFLIRRDVTSGQSTPRLVPLLLWPIEMDYPDGQWNSLRFKANIQHEAAILNPAFKAVLGERQSRFSDAVREICSRDRHTTLDILEIFKPLFEQPHDSVTADFTPLPTDPKLPDDIHCLLIHSAAIFMCDFAAQTLVHELGILENRPVSNVPISMLLRLESAQFQPTELPAEHDRFLITSADPSQRRAVFASRQPPGLLIQGPPGTGKSQTIVNIVADAVARGERVLVVCQKQAALEVVNHRLTQNGFGSRTVLLAEPSRDRRPFLEALRGDLEDLRNSNDRSHYQDKHRELAAEVERLEQELDQIHDATHRQVQDSGLTYQQVLARLIEINAHETISGVSIIRQYLKPLHFQAVLAMSERLHNIAPLWYRSKFESSPYHVLKRQAFDQETKMDFREQLQRFIAVEEERSHTASQIHSDMMLEKNDAGSMSRWLAEHRSAITSIPDAAVRLMSGCVTIFERGKLANQIRDVEYLVEAITNDSIPVDFSDWPEKLMKVDDHRLERSKIDAERNAKWSKTLARWIWIPYLFSRQRLVRDYSLQIKQLDANPQQLVDVFCYEQRCRARKRQYTEISQTFNHVRPSTYLSETDFLAQARSLAEDLRIALNVLQRAESCPCRADYLRALSTADRLQIESFVQSATHKIHLLELRERSLEQLERLRSWIEDDWIDQVKTTILVGISRGDKPEKHVRSTHAESLSTAPLTSKLMAAWDTITAFQEFRLRSDILIDSEKKILSAFAEQRDQIDAYSEQMIADVLRNTIIREALAAWRQTSEEQSPALLMNRSELESICQRLDETLKQLELTSRELVSQLQNPNEIAVRSDWNNYVMLTGPRSKKLREIVEACESLGLYQLRPVWLANPDVVSEVFPLRSGLFDLVIFDEASQLPVEYALPAIFRGKRVVVSGDDKQLPPTRFFAGTPDEDDESESDLESAADDQLAKTLQREVKDCSNLLQLAATVLPTMMLSIHYRSRYRQLIDFSNAAFYRNNLSVPILHSEQQVRQLRPFDFRAVEGIYSDQCNEREAEDVVDFLRRLWCDPNEASPPTVGVVTFNLKQAELIEDLLEVAAEEDEAFREHLQQQRNRRENDVSCGFFVKNLENVQGDERDWMIFSTTFGPSSAGGFSRQFGALSQYGGERRLNVAITRAKQRMTIFCSMPIEQISDLRNSSWPTTPRDYLQGYLMYARSISNGQFDTANQILHSLCNTSETIARSHSESNKFVCQIQNFLEDQGFLVARPGVNDAFGFDLAVRHEAEDVFAIGIECDSPRHPDLINARYREIWRPAMLKSTVSAVHRVYSRLWLIDAEQERLRLLDAVKSALSQRHIR